MLAQSSAPSTGGGSHGPNLEVNTQNCDDRAALVAPDSRC